MLLLSCSQTSGGMGEDIDARKAIQGPAKFSSAFPFVCLSNPLSVTYGIFVLSIGDHRQHFCHNLGFESSALRWDHRLASLLVPPATSFCRPGVKATLHRLI